MKGKKFCLVLLFFFLCNFSGMTVNAGTIDLNLAVLFDAKNLNPYMGYGTTETFVVGFIYDTLLTWSDERGLLPGLADGWYLDEEGKSVVFELNKEAKWHDGKPVTAEDVEFSFNLIHRHRFPGFMAILSNLTSVEVLDRHTVKINLRQVTPGDLRLIGTAPSILPAHIWDQIEDPRNYPNIHNPVGCGPFRLHSRRDGQYIVLEKTDSHYRYDYNIDRIILYLVRDETVGIMALRRGDFDALRWSVNPYVAEDVRENPAAYANIRVACAPATNVTTLMFNLRNRPFKDDRVREAIAFTLDQEELIEKVLLGYGEPQGPGLVAPVLPFYNDKLPPLGVSFDRTSELLTAAGFTFKDGTWFDDQNNPLTVEILTLNHSLHLALGELVVNQLQKAGIRASFRPLTPETHRNLLMAADFQAALTGLNLANSDMMFFYFHSSRGIISEGRVTGFNYGGYYCPEFDALSEAMRRELDEEKCRALIIRLQENIAGAYYHLPLFTADILQLYSEVNFTNWVIKPNTGFDNGENYRSLIPR